MRIPTLYCVLLTPRKERNLAKEEEHIRALMRGPGTTTVSQLLWGARAIVGSMDHREPKFLTWQQRLAVFRDRKKALSWARMKENEFWSATVRMVRVMDAEPAPTSGLLGDILGRDEPPTSTDLRSTSAEVPKHETTQPATKSSNHPA